MKHNFQIFIVITVLILHSCKKNNGSTMMPPDERLIEVLDNYQNNLESANSGWKAYIWTGTGGGYSFYFNFNNKNEVSMISDEDTVSGLINRTSTYRLKALQQPSLIFDTYNYLHKLSDPNPAIMGGIVNKGLTSDIEFAFLSSGIDTIKLQGLANKTPLTLVKASDAEATQYKNGRLKELLKAVDNFVKNSPYLYLQFSDGKKIQVSFSKKTIILSYINNGTEIKTMSSDFAYMLNGIFLKNSLNYNGNEFNQLFWDDIQNCFYVTINNVRTNVLVSQTPIIPFYLKFGAGKDYSLITVNPATLTGLSSDFLTVFNAAKTGLAGYGSRSLNYFSIQFTGPEDMTLRMYYNNTSGTNYTATFLCKIVWTELDKVNFTILSKDNNATVISIYVTSLTNYLEQNQFALDWFTNLTPGSTSMLGGMKKVSNPSSFFFGVLSK